MPIEHYDTTIDADGQLVRRLLTEEEVAALVVVPYRVSRLQAKLTLSFHGLLADVEAAIAQAGQTQPAIPLYWAETSHIERDHFGLAFIANLMGWDGAFVDALFVEAAGYL